MVISLVRNSLIALTPLPHNNIKASRLKVNWSPHQYFRHRFFKWLNKRIPAANEHHLNLNSIFILPTGFGWSFILLSLCLFLLGTNYQNNLMLLLSYLCLSIMLLTLFYTHQNFARLALKALPVKPFHADEEGQLHLRIVSHENGSTTPCFGELQCAWLDSEHAYKSGAKLIRKENKARLSSFRVALGEEKSSALEEGKFASQDKNKGPLQSFSIPIHMPKRGRFGLGRLTISCDFPLGLYKCWTHIDFSQQVTVYATAQEGPVTVDKVAAGNVATSTMQNKNATSNEDFYALYDYEVGQPLNRVSWKHVAKNGNWVSKSFTSLSPNSHVLSYSDSLDTEVAISALTHAVIHWTQSDRTFGLRFKTINILPNQGAKHMHECLEALACFDKSMEIPFGASSNTVSITTSKKQRTSRAAK